MTNSYNDGKWHGWNGGECPVHPETIVDYLWVYKHKGETQSNLVTNQLAGCLLFEGNEHGDLVAFRVVKEYKEPREWWILWSPKGNLIGNFSKASAEDKNRTHYAGKGEIVHVREVLD